MTREISPCPTIPGVYYRLRGEDQVYRAPITANIVSIVENLMLKDPEGYWGPQIDLPYPTLPHPVEDTIVDDDGSEYPRFDGASEEDLRDEEEYYRQLKDMTRLYDLRHEANVALRKYLEAWRAARRAAHERAIEIVSPR